MTPRIHPTAIVDPTAELALDVVVEPFAIIGPNVKVGAGTTIGARATLYGLATLGAGCNVGIGAVIGADPQDRKYRGEPTRVEIGAETDIREYVTVHRGTSLTGSTVVGSRCLLMSYAHVAHDCTLGDDVVLTNAVQLGGHVCLGDSVYIGGSTAVHQFVRVGVHAFIGGGARVMQDIPPFVRVAGNPLRHYGINSVGLKRAQFADDVRAAIHRACRLLFNSSLSKDEAAERLCAKYSHISEVMTLLEFMDTSKRGVLV